MLTNFLKNYCYNAEEILMFRYCKSQKLCKYLLKLQYNRGLTHLLHS